MDTPVPGVQIIFHLMVFEAQHFLPGAGKENLVGLYIPIPNTLTASFQSKTPPFFTFLGDFTELIQFLDQLFFCFILVIHLYNHSVDLHGENPCFLQPYHENTELPKGLCQRIRCLSRIKR